MPDDSTARERIIDAAAELFADHGYEGTRIRMVALAAGVSPNTIRRLTGRRSDLFAAVMAAKVHSDAADRLWLAASDPASGSAVNALREASAEVFTAPARSWDILELEALTRSHRDEVLRMVESERIELRMANLRRVLRRIRESEGLDGEVADDALAHLVMAVSVGLAILDPVLGHRPRAEDWNALIAKIGLGLAPMDLDPTDESDSRVPWRLRVDIPDAPGALARLIRALGGMHLYPVAMQVVGASEHFRTLDVSLFAPEEVGEAAILAAALTAGRDGFVTRGSEIEGQDLPTRLMDIATELLADPAAGPRAARELLEAESVQVIDPNEGVDDRENLLRLQWTSDEHVVLRRSWAPFARAEQARASALLRFTAEVARMVGAEDAVGWMENIRDGMVWIRLAQPGDAEAVAAMHERSSERTRYLRYVSLVEWHEVQIRRLAGGHRGASLVVMSDSDTIVAVGNVFPAHQDPLRAAEIALIIEDEYQGRGLGGALLLRQVALARRLGFREVIAEVLAENIGMQRLLARTGLDWQSTVAAGVATWRAELDPLAHGGSTTPRHAKE